MLQEILVQVSFLRHTLTKKDSGVVEGDYNSTKLVFEYAEDISQKHVRFKMSNPNGEVVLLQELTEHEVILVGQDADGNLCSLFDTPGLYPFELVLWDEDSKLTSAPGFLSVSKRQVDVGQGGGAEHYLPLFDEILTKVGLVNNMDLSVTKEGNATTISVTNLNGEKQSATIYDGVPGGGGATNAKDIAYDYADESGGADNVEIALRMLFDQIRGMYEGDTFAPYFHNHDATEINFNYESFQDADLYSVLVHILDNLGSGGGGGGATNAKHISYHGDSYIGGSTVEEALDNASSLILDNSMGMGNKADIGHTHELYELYCPFFNGGDEPFAENAADAINYLVEQVGNVSAALDELHAYAQSLISGGDSE